MEAMAPPAAASRRWPIATRIATVYAPNAMPATAPRTTTSTCGR